MSGMVAGRPINPYDTAVAAVEEEIAHLNKTLQVLLAYRSEDSEGDTVYETPKPTNSEAVRTILEAASPLYLSTQGIVGLGQNIGGRTLNTNSVRWVLTQGPDAHKFDKKREHGRTEFGMRSV